MTHPVRNRTHLFVGCGSAALALALMFAPQRAEAQGIQASGSVVSGAAEINTVNTTTTQVNVFSPTAVIDWTPQQDNNGDALDFLRTGATAIFQGGGQFPDFAVLNRILPSANGNIVVIDGAVISQLFGQSGAPTSGGLVAFYSPTGILIGSNATFDVGSLLLTTLDTSPTSFDNFAGGGFLTLQGQQGSTARITINPGAQITASAENSFFAVVAADIEMRGTARINGSHAYVAGEVVNLRFSNGLFDISVPVGTAASGNVLTVDGNVGGVSSTGIGDNHMIYGVAVAQNDPISMLFRGNLGFDPAQSAGIVNGEIILSANHNVFGRFVDGGTISDGIDATFPANSALSTVRADIFLEDFTATSSLLALGSHRVQAVASGTASSVTGNLLLVGRETAELLANNGQNLSISGDLLVDARDYGVVSSGLQSLDQINATGGLAVIDASQQAVIQVNGNALITADAFGGADDLNRIAGSAQGGTALIGAQGGSVIIDGEATISARGLGTSLEGIQTGAEARGGTAHLYAIMGGTAAIGQNLTVTADALAPQGSLFNPSTPSDAYGGQALISVFDGGGTLTVGGMAQASASARAGSSNNSGAGSIADAGVAAASVTGAGTITITGMLQLDAEATGGANAGGVGGIARGGRASAITVGGGTIAIGGQFDADTLALGGNGQTGGDAFGGIAGANAITGLISIGGSAFAGSEGVGGSATYGTGGNGGLGRGGNSFFQADGTLTETARITIGGDAVAFAQGVGGDGGAGDSSIAGGNGGIGYGGDIAVPNQADPNFGSGAYILAGGDNGTIIVNGDSAVAVATAVGGRGGDNTFGGASGNGGDAFGGLAQVGLALFGQNGSVGLGRAQFSSVLAQSDAFAGDAGQVSDPALAGNGGDATGGGSVLTVRAGEVTSGTVDLSALAFAGSGLIGGMGLGGFSGILGSLGGSLITGSINLTADGFGGSGFSTAPGGDGRGGEATFDFQGLDVSVSGDVRAEATGYGGSNSIGNGGNGNGGTAQIGVLGGISGNGTITGNAGVIANGFGGSADDAATGVGGTGTGGVALAQAQGGGLVQIGSLQVTASGRGGVAETSSYRGGNGRGGSADLSAIGIGSRLIVERNTSASFSDDMNLGGIVAANGFGGMSTGGAGIGGEGIGGRIGLQAQQGGSIALPTSAGPNSTGDIRLLAQGFGGDSSVDGGAGGAGGGGFGLIGVDGAGSSIIMGNAIFSVFAQGGSGLVDAHTTNGGAVIGGARRIQVFNGGEATLALVGGVSGGEGGDGTGAGTGGNATAGSNRVELINGRLNIIGTLAIADQSTGGNGTRGGDVSQPGEGGGLSFTATDSTITFVPNPEEQVGITLGGVSLGGNGTTGGGNATASNATFVLTNTDMSGGVLRIDPRAQGGRVTGAQGNGGDATGGNVAVNITDSTLGFVGETLITANADGGDGGLATGSRGGNATSGVINATLTNSVLTAVANQSAAGILRLTSRATGGLAELVGTATSGRASLTLANATITVDQLLIEATAFSDRGRGAAARGGNAVIDLAGASQLTADLITINANAITGGSGSSIGGAAALLIAAGSTAVVTADAVTLSANGSGADPAQLANAAGQFFVDILGGSINAQVLTASALGDTMVSAPPASRLRADIGSINIADMLIAQAFGDIEVETAEGGIIGSPAAAATTTAIEISSQGQVDILGDNDGVIGLGGNSIDIFARDLDIRPGARIGAEVVTIFSLERDHTAILGGTDQGTGFTLTADEIGRIAADDFTFVGRSVITNDPDQPEIIIRDFTISGSLAGGFSRFTVFPVVEGPGIVRVEGTVSFINAADGDEFLIGAGDRIEVVTPGGIRITNSDGGPGGILSLIADDIWVADADLIAQLQGDVNFTGRDELLAIAAQGSNDPLGYLRARGVVFGVGQSLLVRNTGSEFEQGGITVGNGGLSIAGQSQFSQGTPLDVFAYGRRERDDGTFVVGADFFNEVNFNRTGQDPTTYLDIAAFNDCIINTSECPQPPSPPPPPPPSREETPVQINNPEVFERPVLIDSVQPAVEGEEEERFGIDFPERPDAPLISEDPLLDDPVTSGGDATLYGTTPTPPAGGK